MCQCPKRATFISTGLKERDFLPNEVCQCPKRATFISTKHLAVRSARKQKVCQCPKRATFISTVPSGNPHKHWLPSLIFACICLNILNSAVFSSFSCLFIICSYLADPCFPRPLQILYFIICFSKSLFSNFLNFNRNCLSMRLAGGNHVRMNF